MNPKRITQQLRSFERLLADYDLKQPLAKFLTHFFKENRQMGANDRRTLSRWSYHYFRIGKALADLPTVERLTLAEYLCSKESDLVSVQAPALRTTLDAPLSVKIDRLAQDYGFELDHIFPLVRLASPALAISLFLESLLQQPDLFIRISPPYIKEVRQQLDKHQLTYQEISPTTIALPNGTNMSQYPELVGKIQVQDLSSQQTAHYFKAHDGESWWDACAASGGKSLLLWQTFPGVKLLVSDIRNSILRNLDERFDQAGIKHYRRKLIDLTKDPSVILGNERFDGIIMDIPCSGSGTWGRTPEMMQLFDQQKLAYFVELQRSILRQVVRYLKPNAPLIYITCSIFANENEEQVAYLESIGLRVAQMELLKGYEHRADTMFVARLLAP
ncbi:RsmB/NOP family class I SAM-dependent RNA methyltransferase [Olivibacter ginsenosidimutans]|uniref:RsmB/NOP family class I SAM-dependent RNA methyltransferase n=1 Tax=Olivibacter ginsenosidimutans TaxID=1176537 RepID=A0ABP9AGN3_9SPHI